MEFTEQLTLPVSPVHIVFATDDNYLQHLAVTIASLAENSSDRRINLHIVYQSLAHDRQDQLVSLIDKYEYITASFYKVDTSDYTDFPISGHINLVSYFRLFLTDILPSDIDRVVYLDCDLVIEDDISKLYDYDLSGRPIGAIVDPYNNDLHTRLGSPSSHRYFNAGVLVLDINLWRKTDIKHKFVEFVRINARRLRFHDQDVLNATFADNVTYIPYQWNFQAKTKIMDLKPLGGKYKCENTDFNSPSIIHYTTNLKPWYFRHDVPFEDRYFRYLALTPWRDYTPSDRTATAITIRRLKKRIPFAFRIMNAIRWRVNHFNRKLNII